MQVLLVAFLKIIISFQPLMSKPSPPIKKNPADYCKVPVT
jgi:hypothetical protein